MMISVEDIFVTILHGEIFTRSWRHKDVQKLAPVILFHDSLGCVDMWKDFPLKMADTLKRDVIAFDRLGHGKSRGLPLHLDQHFISLDAKTYTDILLKYFNLNSVVLMGHSVGGGMALSAAAQFASKISRKVEKTISLAAQTFVEDKTLEGIRVTSQKMLIENKVEKLKKFHGEKAENIFHFWVNKWNSKEFKNWNLKEVISNISCPVLAIHGGQDEYGSRAHPELIKNGLPEGQRQIFFMDDCGHFPHFEKPVEVLKAIKEFLAIT